MKTQNATHVLAAFLPRSIAGIRWQGPPLAHRPLVIVLGILGLLVGLVGEAKAQYNAAYTASPIVRLVAGETANVTLKVTNTGTAGWSNTGSCAVVLGYHWFQGPTLVASETQAAPLPSPVSPNQTIELTATVVAPTTPGLYILAWDLRAQCEWFTKLGAAPGRQPIDVVAKP